MKVRSCWLLVVWAASAMLLPAFGREVPQPFRAVTFTVEHDHFLGSGTGTLSMDEGGVRFEEEQKQEHSRQWNFPEIQELKIESPRKIVLRSYQDTGWKFNRDKRFEFRLVEGQIDGELVESLSKELGDRLVTTVFNRKGEIVWRLPAKHRHSLGGGCQGELFLTGEALYFESQEESHSRYWPLARILDVGRMSSRLLRIEARENNLTGSERNYQFQLKRELSEADFRRLWRTVQESPHWLSSLH